MRPDIDPGSGELTSLLIIAIAAWVVWAWRQIDNHKEQQ